MGVESQTLREVERASERREERKQGEVQVRERMGTILSQASGTSLYTSPKPHGLTGASQQSDQAFMPAHMGLTS
jgi:hypothetical protein